MWGRTFTFNPSINYWIFENPLHSSLDIRDHHTEPLTRFYHPHIFCPILPPTFLPDFNPRIFLLALFYPYPTNYLPIYYPPIYYPYSGFSTPTIFHNLIPHTIFVILCCVKELETGHRLHSNGFSTLTKIIENLD